MSQRSKTAVALSFLVLAAIGIGGFWLLRTTEPQVCPICQRSIHEHSSAVVVIDKKRVIVCCIRCGITHNFQVGKPGEVVAVTNFNSNRSLDPSTSFYVEGSHVSMCDPHNSNLMDATKHPYSRTFDRCEPSTYAFAHREDAEEFERANGGKVLSWKELTNEAREQR